MKVFYISLLFSFLIIIPNSSIGVEAPHEIAGIRLGDNVANLHEIEYSNYLKEVLVMDWHGFRKGIISYGICESPGTIVKIRMKYEDTSKKFFNTLLKRYKKKFGAPHEWKGDSFGIKHIWKWKFKDENNQTVNLILQHNLKDQNDTIGNVVKLSLPELDELERLCFIRQCELADTPEEKELKEKRKKTSWDFLIPK